MNKDTKIKVYSSEIPEKIEGFVGSMYKNYEVINVKFDMVVRRSNSIWYGVMVSYKEIKDLGNR